MAEGARLESVYALIAYRGFESLSHRQLSNPLKSNSFLRMTPLLSHICHTQVSTYTCKGFAIAQKNS